MIFNEMGGEVIIKNTPAAIWNFVANQDNWFSSNPEEHLETRVSTVDRRPADGARFYQREKVAGVCADLNGEFLDVIENETASWKGEAVYKYYGLKIKVKEGGTVILEEMEGGTRLSHYVWMEFSESLCGRLAAWYFKNVLGGKTKAIHHTMKELVYFKKHLDKETS